MNNVISIIGGDKRNIYLAEMLKKDNYKVNTYGLTSEEKDVVDIIKQSNVVISATPFSIDGVNINAPFFNEKISISEVLEKIEERLLIAGAFNQKTKEELESRKIKYLDIMKLEEVAVLNTIATAEGALNIAIENTDSVIKSSKVLVLGFGRVGKMVANTFSKNGAKVYCVARKDSDLAWINAMGYNPIDFKKMCESLPIYDIILNTIPCLVLNKFELSLIKKECLIIDLASKPGGINFDEAEKLKINTIHALGLPGKVAPKTSAKIIKGVIEKYRGKK